MAITPTYSWPTPDDTDLVKDGAEAIRDLALAIESTVSALGSKRIEAFTASGTWTVPTGVTYAIASMVGGGGGAGRGSSGTGGASSVAFAGGTVSAAGGLPLDANSTYSTDTQARAGAANSGDGAAFFGTQAANTTVGSGVRFGGRGATIVAADTVTPAASITVTVGAGGVAGTSGAAGGSGYVFIEYYE
jgi:hypothetical protein